MPASPPAVFSATLSPGNVGAVFSASTSAAAPPALYAVPANSPGNVGAVFTGPAAPAAPPAPPARPAPNALNMGGVFPALGGYPAIMVSGTISPNLNVRLVYTGLVDGRESFSSTGQAWKLDGPNITPGIYLYFQQSSCSLVLVMDGADNSWIASGEFTKIEDTVGHWTPDSGETGPPVFTRLPVNPAVITP